MFRSFGWLWVFLRRIWNGFLAAAVTSGTGHKLVYWLVYFRRILRYGSLRVIAENFLIHFYFFCLYISGSRKNTGNGRFRFSFRFFHFVQRIGSQVAQVAYQVIDIAFHALVLLLQGFYFLLHFGNGFFRLFVGI